MVPSSNIDQKIILPALYAPLIAMLLGLIFRGVAFEFRWVAVTSKRHWNFAFAAGSTLAGLCQADVADLLARRTDGRVKMFVVHRALAARAARRDVFERGDYTPIQTDGEHRECLFAFRRGGGAVDGAITCVPRMIATLTPDGTAPPLGAAVWSNTRMWVAGPRPLRDVFTGAILEPAAAAGGHVLAAATIFERFPVALLVPAERPPRRAPVA